MFVMMIGGPNWNASDTLSGFTQTAAFFLSLPPKTVTFDAMMLTWEAWVEIGDFRIGKVINSSPINTVHFVLESGFSVSLTSFKNSKWNVTCICIM